MQFWCFCVTCSWFSPSNNNAWLQNKIEKCDKGGGKDGKTLHLHLWLKFFAIFVDAVAVDFLCLWTVQNFLATFYKCVACQLNRSLSLALPTPNVVYNFPSLSVALCRLAFLALATMATFRTHTLATQRVVRVILSVHCSMRWTFWRGLEAGGDVAWHGLVKAFLPASCNSALSCAIFLACFLCLLFQELDFSNPGCPTRRRGSWRNAPRNMQKFPFEAKSF